MEPVAPVMSARFMERLQLIRASTDKPEESLDPPNLGIYRTAIIHKSALTHGRTKN